MSRSTVALLLSVLALPVLGAESLEIAGGECPRGKTALATAATDAPATERTPVEPAPRATAAGERPAAERARPRWRSFLPGMMR